MMMNLPIVVVWLLSGLGFVDAAACTDGPAMRAGAFEMATMSCKVHSYPSPSRARRR